MDNAFSDVEFQDQNWSDLLRHGKAFGAGMVDPFGATSWGFGKAGFDGVSEALRRARGGSPIAANAGSIAMPFIGGTAALGNIGSRLAIAAARGSPLAGRTLAATAEGAGVGALYGIPAGLKIASDFNGSPNTNMIFDGQPAQMANRLSRMEEGLQEQARRMRSMSMPLPSRNAFRTDDE
jgi:hypothetical protein